MIRVLHVIGIMDRGGAETLIMNLYRHIDHSKVQFDFVVHGPKVGVFESEILELGGKIHHCPCFTIPNLFAYVQWWRNFFCHDGNTHQIVHGHIGGGSAIYLSMAKRYGKYAIAHSHNTKSRIPIIYDLITYPTRYIADYFFACSKEAGISAYGKRIAKLEKRYSVLNNAIPTDGFVFSEKRREEIRKALGIAEDQIIVGHVGRFELQKNHAFLMQIFKAFLEKESRACLVLVGNGQLFEKIKEQAKELEIADRVLFLGVRSDIADLMMAMDVFCFPSMYEGLPVTLVEAQTSGLPCLISDRIPEDCMIIPELIQNKALEDSPESWADALSALCKMRIERSVCPEKVKQAGFDIRNTAQWLEEFYVERAD